jgi:hypothetical protein
MKYQFCIRFSNIDRNSAASKAVADCNAIFSAHGYRDYTLTVGDNSKKTGYYYSLLKELLRFFFGIKKNSLVGIQYPLLSINNVFKHFIKIAKLKDVRFFCIIHDLESLRTGGKDPAQVAKEVENLNCYDEIIVHNTLMSDWLKAAGVIKPMISLTLFDYLVDDFDAKKNSDYEGRIVYAGNLVKSKFIYELPHIAGKQFAVYGPGYSKEIVQDEDKLVWMGEYSPIQIPKELKGSFGLVWDGKHIDVCDEILGNYLKYNNPHKLSLYIAAGLPVIAPIDSAIGVFIKKYNIGVLVKSLHDLENISLGMQEYELMKRSVCTIRKQVINGGYFSAALAKVEKL